MNRFAKAKLRWRGEPGRDQCYSTSLAGPLTGTAHHFIFCVSSLNKIDCCTSGMKLPTSSRLTVVITWLVCFAIGLTHNIKIHIILTSSVYKILNGFDSATLSL